MKKPVSIRLSESTIDYINRQNGDNFSQKLETMILYCMRALPEIQSKVADAENKLKKLRGDIFATIQTNNKINVMVLYLRSIQSYLDKLGGMMDES